MRYWISLAALAAILFSCVSLDPIQRFAGQSLTTVEKFNELPYSFSRHCLDRCEWLAIDSGKIYRELECKCENFRKADRVTQALLKAVADYLHGLQKLSGKKLIDYRLSPLQEALEEEDLGSVQIRHEDAAAYKALTDLLLRGFTGPYRQQKLKAYIAEANEPVQALLAKIEFIETTNLSGLLDFKKERLVDRYSVLLKRKLSDFERMQAAKEYYESLENILQTKKGIAAHANALKAVGRAHQKLYDERNKLSAAETRRALEAMIYDIRVLTAEITRAQKQ